MPPPHPTMDLTPQWPTPSAPGRTNIVVVVLDDVGFAQLGCYGSDIDTPTMDALAANGLQYTGVHSTAMCSPSRASLLTGRNHHAVGVGAISHYTNGLPNNAGKLAPDAATLAELLRPTGYATMAVGKWHLVPPEETNAAGPFDGWPLGRGFERFYGFLDSMTDQFTPDLYRDNHRLDLEPPEGYHLSEDLTDQAVTMVREHRSLAPERPFYLHLAYGACHAPHQAPPEYRQKYRGRFDHGWDIARGNCYARQQDHGILPSGTELAPRNPGVPLWDDVSAEERALFCREQEAFAAFLDHTDVCLGRFVDELRTLGVLDSTIFVLVSDNGASGDAGETGTLNELRSANHTEPGPAELSTASADIGGPTTCNEYPRGWAMVGNTPLRWYKRNVYGGGARVPFIVHWPDGITAPGVRPQFHHLIDVMPTLLEVAGVPMPDVFEGREQIPLHGTSMAYTFDDAQAASTRRVQYFEMLGDRGIYADGWKAVTLHTSGDSYEGEGWQLFHLDEDFSEARDLADELPDKVAELEAVWWEQAEAMNVLPLDDRQAERHQLFPPWLTERASWTFYPGTAPVTADCVALTDRSYTIRASVDVPEGGADAGDGVLIAFGGQFGGSALFVQEGRLWHDFNLFGEHLELTSPEPVPPGPRELTFTFERTMPHGGSCALLVDGETVAERNVAGLLSHWLGPEPITVGRDGMSAVSSRYAAPFPYAGVLHSVEVELGERPDRPEPELYESRLDRQ